MSKTFDPYYEWLGIPPKHQPPNHYRLLGIEVFEDNVNVIERAADRQMAHVRTYQTSKQAKYSQSLLNEISLARICLLDRSKKSEYDTELRAALDAEKSQDSEPAAEVLPAAPGLNINIQKPAGAKTVPTVGKRRVRRSRLWAQPAFWGTLALFASVVLLLALVSYLISRGNRSGDGGRNGSDSDPYPIPDVHLDISPQLSPGADSFSNVRGSPARLTVAEINELTNPPTDRPAEGPWEEGYSKFQTSFDNAFGRITDRFAFCLKMAASGFVDQARALREYGYRPARIRPYRTTEGVLVAAIWIRDGLPWRMIGGVPETAIEDADPVLREKGFLPVDAAGVPTTKIRYLAVWAKLPLKLDTRQLSVATPESNVGRITEKLTGAGFMPLTEHLLCTPDRLRCRVWEKPAAGETREVWRGGEAEFKKLISDKVVPIDVSLAGDEDGSTTYAAVILRGVNRPCRALCGQSAWEHFTQCEELVKSGMSPVAISVYENPVDNTRTAASIWQADELSANAPAEPVEADPVP